MMVNSMKKLLVVVDYQNDFVTGSLGFENAKELDELIAKRIQEYKDNGDQVIYTFDTHYEDYLDTVEGKHLPVKHCLKDSDGHKLYGKVASTLENGDVTFEKKTFPSLELAKYLENKEYQSVELCGLVSNICVLSNVIMVRSALPNVEIYVDKNLTMSFDENMNEYFLKILEGLHINVIG